jgi:hypothetical protein
MRSASEGCASYSRQRTPGQVGEVLGALRDRRSVLSTSVCVGDDSPLQKSVSTDIQNQTRFKHQL